MTDTTHLSARPGAGLVSGLAVLLAGCAGCAGSPGMATWLPMPLQAAHIDDRMAVPASAQTVQYQPARFVVKVKDGETEALSRLYFRDRDAARASYRDWAADKPLFRTMDLVSCTYGGELVLRPSGQAAAGGSEEILAELRAHPLVAYADPDFVAQAEGAG